MRSIIVAVAIAILNGCASPPSGGDVGIAPANRLLAYQSEEKGRDANVTVIREGGVNGAGCLFAIFIDGKLVARLGGDEKARFYLKPGRRLIGVGPDPEATGRCGGSSSFRREVATWVQTGEQQTFRIVFQPQLDIRVSSY
ncbi:3-isopropylmalate dehydratase [Pseudomonas sp. MIS38]|uniref:3-isopropylmalate dehydratase n=1 Tax=Pseudomonas sp. MIS38 TaxID=91465 RepID=UPI001CA65EAB|nr:3-isopropylmalate dehydratase [Pseudomonas sp. MIS38]MBY8958289.1 3-isopropylmalate dehydratase [Pseudomonas sp. MIS38]